MTNLDETEAERRQRLASAAIARLGETYSLRGLERDVLKLAQGYLSRIGKSRAHKRTARRMLVLLSRESRKNRNSASVVAAPPEGAATMKQKTTARRARRRAHDDNRGSSARGSQRRKPKLRRGFAPFRRKPCGSGRASAGKCPNKEKRAPFSV